MGNTVPPRASREATGTGRRGAGTTGRRRSENVVRAEAAPPATPSRRVVTTARNQGRDDDDDDDGDVEKEETARAGRPRAGRALRAGGGDGAVAAPAGKVVLTVKIVMRRKDAEALVARLMKAQSARRERKARMAELKGELRAGSCGGGRACASPAWSRDARIRPMLPPIKENRFERITPVV